MKQLIITVIVLVVPAFFVLIFVMGTHGRLSTLRRRCRSPGTESDPAIKEQVRKEAVARYDKARGTFPANLVARLFGFGPVDNVGAALEPGRRSADG